MRRNSHDRPRAIGRQHVIGYPDGHLVTVQAIYDIGPGENAVLFLFSREAFYLRAAARLVDIRFDIGFPVGSGDFLNQRIFRCQHHKGNAIDSVRARGEYSYLFFIHAGTVQRERDFRALAAPHPVGLHGLDALRPVQPIVPHQFVGIPGYTEEPLLQIAFYNRRIAAPAAAVNHLLVSQHRLAFGTPVHRGLGAVGQPGLPQLQEKPLRPFVIFRLAGDNLPVPVVDSADAFKLLAHVFDIGHSPCFGMDTALDGGVLRRQAEGVEADGMQHIIPLHTLEAGIYVRRSHGIPVAYVQVAGGIGEHCKGIPLGGGIVVIYLVEMAVRPALLPLRLNFGWIVLFNHRIPLVTDELTYCSKRPDEAQ